MKKTKLIALTMVIAMKLIGAGYAAWTDFTEINATVATGELDVNVGYSNITAPPYTDATIAGGWGGYNRGDNNQIVVNVSGLYPTEYAAFGTNDKGISAKSTRISMNFGILNEGSVPVKLDSVEFEMDNEESIVWDYLRTVVHITKGVARGPWGDNTVLEKDFEVYYGQNPDTRELYFKDLKEILEESALADAVFYPGEVIQFGGEDDENSSIRFWLDTSDLDPDNEADKVILDQLQGVEDLGFTLRFNWKQFNM